MWYYNSVCDCVMCIRRGHNVYYIVAQSRLLAFEANCVGDFRLPFNIIIRTPRREYSRYNILCTNNKL